jgi:hypothetical protein
VHEKLGDFLALSSDFALETMAVVSISVVNFRLLSVGFEKLAQDADDQSTLSRILGFSVQDSVHGGWLHQSTSESTLMTALAQPTSTLAPELESLFRSSEIFVTDLTSISIRLNDIKAELVSDAHQRRM